MVMNVIDFDNPKKTARTAGCLSIFIQGIIIFPNVLLPKIIFGSSLALFQQLHSQMFFKQPVYASQPSTNSNCICFFWLDAMELKKETKKK